MTAEGFTSGLLAALWLAALWQAAPILGSQPRDYVDRLRDAIVLGVAIPFVLGFAHLLYGPLCFASAIGLWFFQMRGDRRTAVRGAASAGPTTSVDTSSTASDKGQNLWLMLPLAGVAAAALPALLQPPLSGDTLIYHLPNAAAWARAGSIWDTSTTYWWWPGGSELFASGLLASGAWWSVGVSGAVACALLGMRITTWGVRLGAPAWSSAAVGAALISVPAAAREAGNLGNDVFLTALFVEALWLLRLRAETRPTLGVTVLVKPVGFVFAAIAAVVGRATAADAALAAIPLVAWFAHDAILWRHAVVPPVSTFFGHTMATSIAAHGSFGIATLAVALGRDGAPTIVFLVLPLAGLLLREVRTQAFAGVAAVLAFLFEPFGFASSLPQLAGGAALRFALPAMATGGVVATSFAARAPAVVGTLGIIASALGIFQVAATYWNDRLTRATIPLVAAACAVVAASPRRWRSVLVPLVAGAALICAGAISASRAAGFYANSVRSADGSPTTVFAWLARAKPRAVLVQDLRSGAVSMMTHATRVYDLDVLSDPCTEARALHALLAVGTDPAVPAVVRERRFSDARRCGRTIVEDAAAIVVEPGNQR